MSARGMVWHKETVHHPWYSCCYRTAYYSAVKQGNHWSLFGVIGDGELDYLGSFWRLKKAKAAAREHWRNRAGD